MREIDFRSNAIDPTLCLKLGWKTFQSRMWLFLGLCLFLGFPIGFLVGFISPFPPFITRLISTVVSGSITAGIFYIVLTEIDGKRSDFTMIANVLPAISSISVVSLIGAAPGMIFSAIVSGNSDANAILVATKEITAIGPAVFVFSLIGLLVSFFLYFAYPLLAEYRLRAIETIKLSSSAARQNVRGIVALTILNFLIFVSAVLVGVFFVSTLIIGSVAIGGDGSVFFLTLIPLWILMSTAVSISYATVAHAYRQVFPKSNESVI